MHVKRIFRTLIRKAGYRLVRVPRDASDSVYSQDGLRSIHNHDFTREPAFCEAYARGCQAASDYGWHWRVHIGLWAAYTASQCEGDFVECGVNRGFLSSAVMSFLDWNSRDRMFYLLDTFDGMDGDLLSEADRLHGLAELNEEVLDGDFYTKSVEKVVENFSEWENVRIIKGSVPGTLDQVDATRVAYLHLDMNCAAPEVAALNYFWDRLVPGAVILLDDYGYKGFEPQKAALDACVAEKNVMIVSLPTGQGLLIKPHKEWSPTTRGI